MRRLLALVAAVAMVAGAVLLRGGGGSGDGADGSPGAGDGGEVTAIRLLCAPELEPVCDLLVAADARIEVSVRAPGDVVGDAVGGGELEADAWLVPAPWVGIVDALGAPGAHGPPGAVLARSPLVVAAFDRTLPDCGGMPLGWRCIGDGAGELRPGIDDLDSTVGLLTLGQAGAAFFGDPGYATNDLEVVPEAGGPSFADWAASLLRAVPRGRFASPLDDVLRTGSATYDLAATVEAVAVPAIAGTRQEGSLRVLYPSPMATVDVVAVPLAGGGAGAASALADLLVGDAGRRAFVASGWRVDGEPLPAGSDPAVALPADDGLPDPGVLAALRSRFG